MEIIFRLYGCNQWDGKEVSIAADGYVYLDKGSFDDASLNEMAGKAINWMNSLEGKMYKLRKVVWIISLSGIVNLLDTSWDCQEVSVVMNSQETHQTNYLIFLQ